MAAASVCILSAVLLSNCAKYRPLPLDPVKTEAEIRSRAVPAKLDSDSLMAAAVANNGNTAIARARLAEAEAAMVTAKQRVNPALSAEGGYNRTPDSVSTYSAALAYTIETGGKRAARTLVAEKNAEAARVAVVEAEWQARSAVRTAMSRYGFALKLRDSAQREVDA
ncbi:MAG: TolC family protein, partial [Acidobacteriota bacterium]|nr:TolC family protein [Acidobacteriota bacterium]